MSERQNIVAKSATPQVALPPHSLGPAKTCEGGRQATVELSSPQAGWHRWWDDPLLVFTFVLALATIVLGAATIALWRSTKKLWLAGERQLKHSEDTAKRQLRAYVGLRRYKIEGTANGEYPKVTLTFHNAGQTPAHNLTLQYGIGVDNFPQPHLARSAALPTAKSVAVLLPGGFMKPSLACPGAVSQEEINAINAGAAAIYCFGVVKYDDIFGESRQTEFRLMMGGDLGGYPDKLSVTDTGNIAS